MLQGIQKIHFIGAGGVGMSALAQILLEKGYTVSGSDIKESPLIAHCLLYTSPSPRDTR